MEQEVVKEVLHGSANLSLWGLFLQADIVVKLVMLILLLASVWCWTIIIEKLFLSRKELKLADNFENEFWSGTSLDDIYDDISKDNSLKSEGAISRVFSSAMQVTRLTQVLLTDRFINLVDPDPRIAATLEAMCCRC